MIRIDTANGIDSKWIPAPQALLIHRSRVIGSTEIRRGDDQRHLLDRRERRLRQTGHPRGPQDSPDVQHLRTHAAVPRARRGQVEGVRRPLHREEVLIGGDVHDVDAAHGARDWPGRPGQGRGLPPAAGGWPAGAGGGSKADGGGDGARRHKVLLRRGDEHVDEAGGRGAVLSGRRSKYKEPDNQQTKSSLITSKPNEQEPGEQQVDEQGAAAR